MKPGLSIGYSCAQERGFDSLWVPEHSHIPLTRKSPFPSGGDLPKK